MARKIAAIAAFLMIVWATVPVAHAENGILKDSYFAITTDIPFIPAESDRGFSVVGSGMVSFKPANWVIGFNIGSGFAAKTNAAESTGVDGGSYPADVVLDFAEYGIEIPFQFGDFGWHVVMGRIEGRESVDAETRRPVYVQPEHYIDGFKVGLGIGPAYPKVGFFQGMITYRQIDTFSFGYVHTVSVGIRVGISDLF
ncbi:MAG: hypothetical protein HYS44_03460 [Candidatus Niyogibacteria bacterium]|nr:hypothetical protein [Candidatus Niyogibacteria bacterium]